MQGIERDYCDVCISALIEAWRGLMDASGAEVLRKVRYGKGDTLGLDAIPEITIDERLKEFDKYAILITEELDEQAHRHWPTDADPIRQPLMFFCDPTDRSIQLNRFFERISKDNPIAKIGDLMTDCNPEELWEEMFESPVIITGATGAITCVRKGRIVFSVILNYITGDIFTATDLGIYWYKVKKFSDHYNKNRKINLYEISKRGKRLNFPGVCELGYSLNDCRKFVTFLGKKGYRENFNDSMLFVENPDNFLHHMEPPGPPRTFYLSELQKNNGSVGFILSNGEKIGEWMHWLSFVKYARNENGDRALRVYEISLERPWTKNGMLMSTSSPYSLFCSGGDECYLDISRLRSFKRPSQFRCMIVVVPSDNERIIYVLKQHEYREITNFF